MKKEKSLFVVATPIGNLKDITLRALEVLSDADIILTEDTRRIGWLLKALKIRTKAKLIAFNKENESRLIPLVLNQINKGFEICLVSNAGTPLIADPGSKLIKHCFKKNISVVPIPGVSALTTALSVSGVDLGTFIFLDFLPRNKKAIRDVLKSCLSLKSIDRRFNFFVAYLSPHRFIKTLTIFKEIFGGEKKIFLAKELTKIHEVVGWFSVEELLALGSSVKGEIVLGWLTDD